MKERRKELPEELWDSILNRLTLNDEYGDLQSPSLVCKQFLSITNGFRRKLVANSNVFNSNKCEVLGRALERFKNLKEMELVGVFPESDVNYPVSKIASSALDLQSLCFSRFPISPSADTFKRLGSTMKNLKVLKCSGFGLLRDTDLVHIADAFPRLEEIEIRNPRYEFERWKIRYPKLSNDMVTDAGIEAISHKLRGLRRIYISGAGCSDISLVALSSNCLLLNEITCRSCDITRGGIDWVLCHCTNLTSLKTGFYRSSKNSTYTFEDLKIYATGLRELDIWGYDDGERLVYSIAKAGIPLEKLKLRAHCGFDMHGVTTLLRACPTLKHFKFEGGALLNDDVVRDLCRCLPNIVTIELRAWSSLTPMTFSILAKECPMLTEITVKNESLGQFQDNFVMNLESNYQIRYLDLNYRWRLNDKLLKDIVVTCPNLHTLKVGGCVNLTKEALEEIVTSCPQIKHLKFSFFGKKIKHLKLSECVEILSKTFETRHIKIEFG